MKGKLLLIAAIFAFYFLASFASAQMIKTGVGVRVSIGGGSSGQKCGNTKNSCGTWPNCYNLTDVSYCVNGKIIESYCSYNNIRNTTLTTKTCSEFIVNLTDDDENENSADYHFYSAGTTNLLGSGSISGIERIISTPAISKADLELEHDGLNMIIIIKNLDVGKLTQVSKLIIHKKDIDPDLYGINPIRFYHVELPAQFSFSSLLLKLKYDEDEVENASMLVVYKCSSFNTDTDSCNVNWTKMSNVKIDTTNKVVSLNLTSFSVYMLAEKEQNTTTTTTTTIQSNTTTTSSTTTTAPTTTTAVIWDSGGGGGGSDGTGDESTTTVVTTNEDEAIPLATEEQLDDASTTANTTQAQGTQATTGFAAMVEQNKLLIVSPFIALGAAYVLYYSFQKSGQPFYPKYSGRSKIFKKLNVKGLKKSARKKSNRQYSGTVLKL